MSKDKEIEVDGEVEDCHLNGKIVLTEDYSNNFWVCTNRLPPEKVRVHGGDRRSVLIGDMFSSCHSNGTGTAGGSSSIEPQDADYAHVPSLSDELEVLIMARVPRSEFWKFAFLNKRFLSILRSGEVFKIRKEIGFQESSVLMLASGEDSWWAFDPQFNSRKELPVIPSDMCFTLGDKESLCVGTQLLVSGNEIEGTVIWRYELTTNTWSKGPCMVSPRCLFASATCGIFAYVAGGIGMENGMILLNSAEKYDPDSKLWFSLPRMKQKRKLCSGCYMDKKFYVIGGRDNEGKELKCGEAFDEMKNAWELIPDMLKDIPEVPVTISQSPPLVAVAKNELYLLDPTSNELMVYLKKSNTWKKLGAVPVRADFNRGWGVAFKSLGNELLVIGASAATGHGILYTCSPDPDADVLQWRPLECGRYRLSPFILNCSVMIA